MAKNYKNTFTLDGRLKPGAFVTEAKVRKVKDLFERHLSGDRVASATLQEALTTSDAIFSFAYLTNANFIPDYDEAPRTWTQVAGTRTADNLKPLTLYSLTFNWTDGDGDSGVVKNVGGRNVAPVVPEGTAYPYAYIAGQTSQGAGAVKRGFKTDWTLESRINDGLGAIENLGPEMLKVSLDTEEADVYGALTTQVGAGSALAGGTVPTGATVPANAPFSRDALIRALIEAAEREINGRKVGTASGYNLVVPVGQALYVNFVLNTALGQIREVDGSDTFVYSVNGYNPLAGVSVVESEFVTGSEWYLVPKPGSLRRPVLERVTVRGFETPTLLVEANGGQVVSGSTSSVSEFASFTSDVITLKLRQFGGGVVWDGGAAIVYSNGTGA